MMLFEEESSHLDGPMPKIGNAIGDILAGRSWGPASKIYVVGHTDRVGSDRDNQSLGKKRAEVVRTLLMAKVNTPLETASCGETRPLLSTPDNRPHPHNRRVEIRVSD